MAADAREEQVIDGDIEVINRLEGLLDEAKKKFAGKAGVDADRAEAREAEAREDPNAKAEGAADQSQKASGEDPNEKATAAFSQLIGRMCGAKEDSKEKEKEKAKEKPKQKPKQKPKEKNPLQTKLLAAEELDIHIEPKYLRLHLFHFIPLFRSYILVKNMIPDDVEALFRVNGLSTFTLGVSQMVSMILGLSRGKLVLNGLVWFGIVAQMCNLFVTFLYFATPIPGVLMNQSAIEALENASREAMQAQFYRFENAIAQCSKESENPLAAQKVLDDLHRNLNDEIFARSQLSQRELPVADLTYNEKLQILCGLRMQAARTFLKLKF